MNNQKLVALHDKLLSTKKLVHTGVLLLIRDNHDHVFGAFSSAALRLRHDESYGDARQSFLFRRQQGVDNVEIFRRTDERSEDVPCLHYVEDDELPGGFGIGIGGRSGYFGFEYSSLIVWKIFLFFFFFEKENEIDLILNSLFRKFQF